MPARIQVSAAREAVSPRGEVAAAEVIPPGRILLREGPWDGSPARQLVGERGKDRSSWEIKMQTTET